MATSEIETTASALVAEFASSCSRIRGLSTKFEDQSRFFEDLDHTFTQGSMKLQALLDVLSSADINTVATSRSLAVLQRYSKELSTAVATCERENRLRKRYIGELQVVESKLQTIFLIFDHAVRMDKNDLFSLGKDHHRWAKVLQCVHTHRFEHADMLQRHLQKVIYSITAGNAFVTKAYEKTGKTRKLMMGLGMVYYTAAKKRAIKKARISLARPNIEIAKTMWNLMDSKMMAGMLEKMTVSIRVNKLIFVPRVQVSDVSFVLESEGQIQVPGSEPQRVNPSFSYFRREGDDSIGIRILSPFAIPALQHAETQCGCFGRTAERVEAPKAVVFHIHGGGFIAMSSRSHQSYTRKWANELRTVVFSVDYRLAPEHPYPAAIDDVWAGYLWVVGFSKRFLGIDPASIVVTGDSAGGNLACGLINKAIESGIPQLIPRGGLLTYPALSLDINRYSPSFEVALEDFIVHHTFLKLCITSYVQDPGIDIPTDYLVSPLTTPELNLRRFPPIRIMVGNQDPLEDDCWRFVERLMDAEVDVKMEVYDGMPHGFLGFDLKVNGVREARVAIEQGAQFLQELLAP